MGMNMISVPAANNFWSYVQMQWIRETALETLTFPITKQQCTTRETDHWTRDKGYWPNRSGFTHDPADPSCLVLTQEIGEATGDFEPWRFGRGGSQNLKFVMGRCVDSGSTPVPNAVVQIFRTSTDEFQRETTADQSGYYEAGTDKVGEGHYLVAYKAGSPDIAGTTVNTLTPTNRDGT
jgi:hypothetical protein